MINQMRSIEAKNYNEYWVGEGEEGIHERNASKCTKKCARNIILLCKECCRVVYYKDVLFFRHENLGWY
jgi:hypothetical protein